MLENKLRKVLNSSLIGLDLTGNDSSEEELVVYVFDFLKDFQGQANFLIFTSKDIEFSHPQVSFFKVSNLIEMSDSPLTAIRKKKDSALCLGIDLLKNKKLSAFITAANTGALTACAKINLPLFPHIKRPALLAVMPTKKNPLAVLDVGANVALRSNLLVDFAKLGIAYQKTQGVINPLVGLLNIGTEPNKGTPSHQEAFQKLSYLPNFIGNIEGKAAFSGDIDVLVTDGFSGNIFLKTAEGVASFLAPEKTSVDKSGAILCGVDGLVIKCHGNLTKDSLIGAIKKALTLIEGDFLEKMASSFY